MPITFVIIFICVYLICIVYNNYYIFIYLYILHIIIFDNIKILLLIIDMNVYNSNYKYKMV